MAKKTTPKFNGFEPPHSNYFRMPNSWTDITADIKSLAELKVIEYVLRHTWGFREYGISKRITTDEFMHGRKRSDRTRIDNGTGLAKSSVVDGLSRAVEHGYLDEYIDATDKGRIKKQYQLRMKGDATQIQDSDSGVANPAPPVREPDISGQASEHRTEKETKETNTVNGNNHTSKSPVSQLKDLNQPVGETEVIADEILQQLGDDHSRDFYRLVAAKIPADVIRSALSEIKHDGGAESPARVFTARMNRWALEHLKRGIG